MRAATKFGIIAAGLAVGSMFGAPAGYGSGDAPWCAVAQIGGGAGVWDCEYETVEECLPSVLAGNHGHCSPNPYASDPAPTSVPNKNAVSAPSNGVAPGAAQSRKFKKDAK